MKTIRILCFLLLTISMTNSANAQFFKKLKKRVENAAEDAVLNKAEQKTREKTEETIDTLLTGNVGKKNQENPDGSNTNTAELPNIGFGEQNGRFPGGMMGSVENLPATYEFEWAYTLEMEGKQFKSKNEGISITYYFKEAAPYWGAVYETGAQQGMTMVYNGPSDQMLMFMDQNGSKMVMTTKMPKIDINDNEEVEEYTMKKIGSKNILGYDCDGFEMENSDYVFTMYLTFDTTVSFSDIYGKSQHVPQGFDPNWLKKGDQEGLMMEMEMVDKAKPKNNMTMRCTNLEKTSFAINTGDYKSFGK